MRVTTNQKNDPGGKRVDIYPPIEFLRTFVFDDSDGIQAKLFDLTIDAIIEISNSTRKRVRERDLTVWSGKYTNRLSMRLYIVGVPYGLHGLVFDIFNKHFHKEPEFVEINYSHPADFMAKPFVRYNSGRFIWYAAPFSKLEEVPLPKRPGIIFEPRSWKLLNRKKDARTNPELPEHVSPGRHTFDIWQQNRNAGLEFVYRLKAACTYNKLRSILQKHFGIRVFEEDSPEFAQYGLIRLSRNWKSDGPAVRILIRADLDNSLKYVVLAHEFSHYLLHFPLLLLSATVEEHSWELPELEQLLIELLTKRNLDLLPAVEDEADDLASYFLIPPWTHPINKIANVMLEGGHSPTPQELIWRFLQPLFPEDGFADPTWNDLDKIYNQAFIDAHRVINSEPDQLGGLFDRMLRAALRVDAERDRDLRVQEGLDTLFKEMEEAMAATASMKVELARQYVAGLLEKTLEQRSDGRGDLLAYNQTFCREIILPLEWDGRSLFPRVPLIPSPYNRDGDIDNDWNLAVNPSSSPAGTIREWGTWKRDHGLILYRFESWQKKILKKL